MPLLNNHSSAQSTVIRTDLIPVRMLAACTHLLKGDNHAIKVQNNQRAQNAVKQIYGPIYYYDNGVMKTIKFYNSVM